MLKASYWEVTRGLEVEGHRCVGFWSCECGELEMAGTEWFGVRERMEAEIPHSGPGGVARESKMRAWERSQESSKLRGARAEQAWPRKEGQNISEVGLAGSRAAGTSWG